jgi:hypothetical protein
MQTQAHQMSDEIKDLGLEPYVLELETDGLTIVPPEVTGVTPEFLDECTEILLNRFTEMTGCPISLEHGPEGALNWGQVDPGKEDISLSAADAPDPTQMLIQQLLQLDRHFRDLAVNPAVDALIDHMMGGTMARDRSGNKRGRRSRRLSSTNSFVKWQGDYGYGPTLGLHADQAACPLPWGSTALTANATWTLTDYTKEDGALAWVPGSHKKSAHPTQPMAAQAAIAAECPRGSAIVFHGATWHGAFPKLTPGLRLCAVSYYRHNSVLPQENLTVTMDNQPWSDCDDPERMRELIGFDDMFPYVEQSIPVPAAAS